MVAEFRNRRRRRQPRPGFEPREYGHRCGNQRTGHRACAYDVSGLGSHQRPACATFPGFAACVEDLLDRLPEGDHGPTQDRHVSRLAPSGSGGGPTPAQEVWLVTKAFGPRPSGLDQEGSARIAAGPDDMAMRHTGPPLTHPFPMEPPFRLTRRSPLAVSPVWGSDLLMRRHA